MSIKDKAVQKAKDYAVDKAREFFFPKTTGESLKEDLGLSNFLYPWIIKSMGLSIDIFVVIVDSRFPTIYLPMTKVKKMKSLIISRISRKSNEFQFDDIKFTPPIQLDDFDGTINNKSIFMRIDIAGEQFMNKRVYEHYLRSVHKKIKIY
jgi:hypothetical protein